ncbi:MobA/MobL family protein [Lachnospiraceae bacterium OttesenSCG-928-D06]|nr:MobA/MobL family protein [Lachnospiraceae bacterium OttesenSCG-928-D06]
MKYESICFKSKFIKEGSAIANYHFSVKPVSRGQGRSVVEAAAYRSGEKLRCDYYGQSADYTRKSGICHTEIILPPNAPHDYKDRQTLWNAVEYSERRIDSRLAREVEISLPNELTVDEQIILVRNFVTTYFVKQGMCADIAIHEGRKKDASRNNPHAHILLTTRHIDEDGFHLKNRDWDKVSNVGFWRKQWADIQNKEYERRGLDIKVSHESYEKQGIDQEATKYLGPTATALERYGICTKRGNENRSIIARNKEREIVQKAHQLQKKDRRHARYKER